MLFSAIAAGSAVKRDLDTERGVIWSSSKPKWCGDTYQEDTGTHGRRNGSTPEPVKTP
jgi:hypothetical protein